MRLFLCLNESMRATEANSCQSLISLPQGEGMQCLSKHCGSHRAVGYIFLDSPTSRHKVGLFFLFLEWGGISEILGNLSSL